MSEQAIRDRLRRADDLVKAASARPDPRQAILRAGEVLESARELLDEVADEVLREELAVQIARRFVDIDGTIYAAAEPTPGVRRAPTAVDDPDRVPPGQHLTPGFPILHVGRPPSTSATDWRLTVTGRVDERRVWSLNDLRTLGSTTVRSDFHCVTGWSRLDNDWTGVPARTVIARSGPRAEATHAVVAGHPAYTANLPLDALTADDVLLAWAHDGRPLDREHGGPLRLVVPSRYGWKSVKWVTEIRLTERDVSGYWEERGYHDNADPWRVERFRGD